MSVVHPRALNKNENSPYTTHRYKNNGENFFMSEIRYFGFAAAAAAAVVNSVKQNAKREKIQVDNFCAAVV